MGRTPDAGSRRSAHDRSCSPTTRTQEIPMILATTQFADWDQFWSVFSNAGAEKRAEHGCKGALVFRDETAADRVWVAFDWDDAGWERFVSAPPAPPVMKKAGHLSKPYTLSFAGAVEA